MQIAGAWALRRDGQGPPPAPRPRPVLTPRLAEAPGRPLLCRACGHPLTDDEARLTIDGQHQFRRQNPAGYEHDFACFRAAPGCHSQGVPSIQATWFPGFHWWIQVCRGCGEHLGWLFFRGEDSFYGLLVEALVEASAPP